MIFVWVFFNLVIYKAYARYTDKAIFAARSMEYVEPQTIKHRQVNDKCPLFCSDWHTPFYGKEVGGCVALNSSMKVGDSMFCPDLETIKSWSKEDELKYEALFEKPLNYSDYEVLKEIMEERELRLGIYPWDSKEPVESQNGDDFRKSKDNGVARRRGSYYGSAHKFVCFGYNLGRWVSAHNFHQRPYGVNVHYHSKIEGLLFYYKLESTRKTYTIGGGAKSWRSRSFNFETLPSGCVDQVDLQNGVYLNAIRFHGGKKTFGWYGRHTGTYHTIKAPSGRCLGDVRMRTNSHNYGGIYKICLAFNAYKCVSCGSMFQTICDKYGRKERQCSVRRNSRCKTCPVNFYESRPCSPFQTTFCIRCISCARGYVAKKKCTRTTQTVCARK